MADFIFRSHRREVLQRFREARDIGMEAVAAHGEANAKREITRLVYDKPESPSYVRTGRLRNSISNSYVKDEQTAYIGTNVEYAPYVEYGTSKMHSRHFLLNAAQNYTDEYKNILSEALKTLSK